MTPRWGNCRIVVSEKDVAKAADFCTACVLASAALRAIFLFSPREGERSSIYRCCGVVLLEQIAAALAQADDWVALRCAESNE